MKLLMLILILLIGTISYGQKQGSIWYFGDGAGLDFNSGFPVALTDGQIPYYPNPGNHAEGSSVICDSAGSLLFYSNGEKVWNKNHIVMPNGDSLLSNSSSTQAALIVPQPQSDDHFFLFTTDAFTVNNLQYGLRYSIIDMCLESENGDVIPESKNILLLDTVAEKITAVKHFNETDYWIITHKYWSDDFYAFRLDHTGIVDTVVSTIGSVHEDIWFSTETQAAIGQLKVSPNGTKLATCFSNTNPAISELFDFDNSTGIVSNHISLPTDTLGGINLYGVEFSPDNSKLYFSAGYFGVYQYDLTAGGGNTDSIVSSKNLIADPLGIVFGMQLGPDGKIYLANLDKSYLASIDSPNDYGISCNYIDSAVSLNGKLCSYGIPNFVTNYDYSNKMVNCSVGINESEIYNFEIYPNPATDYAILKFEPFGLGNHTVNLYDIRGQLVKEIKDIITPKLRIDIDDLSSGLYFCKVLDDGQFRFTGKLTIE